MTIMPRKSTYRIGLLCALFTVLASTIAAAPHDGFPLVAGGRPAPVCHAGRSEVVRTALAIYEEDVRRVAGSAPAQRAAPGNGVVVVGTLTERERIEPLLRAWGVSVAEIGGQWEAFRITEAVQGTQRALFVVGSDARGTAYGVLELSRLMGVSPWEWWADVAPRRSDSVVLPAGFDRTACPSVRYRGIFLNDEDWGLDPWGTRFEASDVAGKLGPKTYSRVFELLLRLRANTIWPAMHASTVAFYRVEGNREAARRYGIVVGTSHCEPMMRNNVGEWDPARYGAYDFAANRAGVERYWRERVREVSRDETLFTLGMRGIHDGRMAGAETLDEQTRLTGEVIRAQRRMLGEELRRPVEKIPQMFVPYKEVLAIYDNGLAVPDDVTLMWCDDNYGYLTRLLNATERMRSGGAGVYYHVSYYGKPHDYLWLATTQPALMAAEMHRAWEHGARTIWILNVGDLKPAEYHTELFLDMAWNIRSVDPARTGEHLAGWLCREFGREVGRAAALLIEEHYRLAAQRKPEHMGWSRIQQPGFPGGFSPVGDTEFGSFAPETFDRLETYARLQTEARRLGAQLPRDRRDAWFELVQYPVEAAALMNRKLLYAQFARRYAAEGLAAAGEYARAARQAYDSIGLITEHYNREIAGGKWQGMMSMSPRDLPVFAAPACDGLPAGRGTALWVDGAPGRVGVDTVVLPAFVRSAANRVTVNLFSASESTLESLPAWLRAERRRIVPSHERLTLRADFSAPGGADYLSILSRGRRYVFRVERVDDVGEPGAAMVAGVAAVAGDGFTKADGPVAVVEGLGHSGRALSVEKGGRAEYLLRCDRTAEADVVACFVPRHPAATQYLRFRLVVDGAEAGVFDLRETFGSEKWKIDVLRNQARRGVRIPLAAGPHRIGIEPLDEALLVDGVFIDRTFRRPYVLRGFTR